ncbi:MAG: macrolide ABC transporter ATP-binding protein [Chloroflexi bacterium RBG_13_56_8]|nr:MAG: macrolide ABC transporter ATP-binding protein [Chloroflexi bacterium RBG_13_56_8]
MTETDSNVVIRSVDVTRVYRVDRLEVHALRGINLKIERGEFVALMGRSGSGKTTLLNIIGALDHPTTGEIYLYDQEISGFSDRKLTEIRRNSIGFVFQSFALMPTMSAFENVELSLRLIGVGRRERRRRAMESLELVGLTRWANHRPHEMSGGQQQRVAIARALVNQPSVILADEPTGELDSTTGSSIMQLFQTISNEEHYTIIMASHDPTVQEYADYTLHMADGQIVNGR